MKITSRNINTSKGRVTLYRIENNSGASVVLSSLGAGINSIIVPDNQGYMADVALGYEDVVSYFNDGPCMGKTPGRYANRIAKGQFTLDGIDYQLSINNGTNALHGGPDGFHNQIWTSELDGDSVVFRYFSINGEEGYPGNLQVTVRYTWSEDNRLIIEFNASTDTPTIVNLTNHTYFNLSGHDSGSILSQRLKLNASRYLPTDNTLIPFGGISDVRDTPMDFCSGELIGNRIKEDFPALIYGKGYDSCWVIDNADGTLKTAALLTDDISGRSLEVLTTQPAVQIYTGNWLKGCPVGKDGCEYSDYDGVAIECQGMPDAPNHNNFPSQRVNPNADYRHLIIFKFTTI